MSSNVVRFILIINEAKLLIFNFFKNINTLFTYDSDYNELKIVGNKYIYIKIHRKLKWYFYF